MENDSYMRTLIDQARDATNIAIQLRAEAKLEFDRNEADFIRLELLKKYDDNYTKG